MEENQIYFYYQVEKSNDIVINVAEEVLLFDIVPGTVFSDVGIGWNTHTCDGSCGGANNIVQACASCRFIKDSKGKIAGCACDGFGFCCHSVTADETPRF